MKNFSLQSDFSLSPLGGVESADSSGSAGAFEGVGYTGDVVSIWGMAHVFDLSSTTSNPVLPALVNHSPDKRAGVIDGIAIGTDVKISGKFLESEHGKAVQSESKAGFPWQMSIGIVSRSEEYLREGTALVNGRVINAPAYICRNNQITEISFVPVGADTNTEARALSAQNQQSKPAMSEQAPDYKAQAEALQAQLSAAQAEIDKARLEGRKIKISALKADKGFELNEKQEKALLAVSDEDFDALSELLGQKSLSADLKGVLTKDVNLSGNGQAKELSAGEKLVEMARNYK